MRCQSYLLWRLLVMSSVVAAASANADELPVMHRRPSSAVLSTDETTLYVANRRSGTLSTVNLKTGDVSERVVGQQLASLVRRPGSQEVLAVDFAAAELIVLRESDSGMMLQRRLETAAWPVSVAVSESGKHCCVTSLWSRRVTLHSLEETAGAQPSTVIDLPFAPRATAFLDERYVAVADAFGGRVAVVDCVNRRVLSQRELPIHNIRSLLRDGDRLLMTHQTLSPAARTEAEHIHWGVLMQNEISSLPIESLADANVELKSVRKVIGIGGPGNGAGDPQAIVGLADRLLVSLGGTDELALIDRVGVRETRVPTGARPVDAIVDQAGVRAFVVNELDDSVSLVDLTKNEIIDEVSLGPSPAAGLVERGERAFFSARLSLESWMSCHSCHTDGHTNNQLADTLGDGGYGDAKRVPSLLGVWSTAPWAWNGKHSILHSQVAASLRTTMHSPQSQLQTQTSRLEDNDGADSSSSAGTKSENAGDAVAAELAAYLTTLSRPPAILMARGEEAVTSDVEQGARLFEASGCVECHDPFRSLTTDGTFDVGLPDRAGNRRFNPPALGGVSQRDRLLHDGRAKSLDDVLGRFEHPNALKLSRQELKLLVEYLNRL